jgi:hypothetical protein
VNITCSNNVYRETDFQYWPTLFSLPGKCLVSRVVSTGRRNAKLEPT